MACGTVRSYRKGLPRDITDAQTEEIKCLKQEESVYRQNGTTTCIGWKERKLVYVLTNTPVSPTSNSEVERSVKVGNKWQKTTVTQPCIDLFDEGVTTYTRLMKGSVGIKKLTFFYLFNLSISNA